MCPRSSLPGSRSYSMHRFWVVAATIGAMATPVPARANGPFVPWTQLFETGVAAKSIAVSDLDGDGHLDLVTHDGGQYSILMGSGTGTFGASLDFTVTSSACSEPAIGDLNGDGKPDLAIGDFGSNTVAVLLGNGNGTFGPRTDFATGNTPASVAIGDLNGDARPDLLVSNAGSSTVSVLLGNGDGTLMPKVDYDAGSEPTQLGLADFNHDGHLDAAAYSLSSRRRSPRPARWSPFFVRGERE